MVLDVYCVVFELKVMVNIVGDFEYKLLVKEKDMFLVVGFFF